MKNTPSRPQNKYVSPVTTADHAEPMERNSLTFINPDSAGSITAPVPPITGVPAAPNGGFGALKYRPTTAAANGGNPRPISSGAASAPGVPNPAAPSM